MLSNDEISKDSVDLLVQESSLRRFIVDFRRRLAILLSLENLCSSEAGISMLMDDSDNANIVITQSEIDGVGKPTHQATSSVADIHGIAERFGLDAV